MPQLRARLERLITTEIGECSEAAVKQRIEELEDIAPYSGHTALKTLGSSAR